MSELPRTRTLNNEEKLIVKIINLCPNMDLKGFHLNDLQRVYDCITKPRKKRAEMKK